MAREFLESARVFCFRSLRALVPVRGFEPVRVCAEAEEPRLRGWT